EPPAPPARVPRERAPETRRPRARGRRGSPPGVAVRGDLAGFDSRRGGGALRCGGTIHVVPVLVPPDPDAAHAAWGAPRDPARRRRDRSPAPRARLDAWILR